MAKSRRKKITIWSLSIVLLLALVLIGDRVAASVAEGQISDTVAQQAKSRDVTTKRPPDVDITGFPFLTQVIGGEYSQIDISMVDVESGEVALPRVDITAKRVEAAMSDLASGKGKITAKELDAKARMDFDTLGDTLKDEASNVKVTPGEGNSIDIAATVEFAEQSIKVEGTADVKVSEKQLTIAAQDFQPTSGNVPPGAEQAVSGLSASFSRDIPLPDLPYDLKLGDLTFDDDNIVLSASAKDVPLNS